jgi:hypothetical protein
VFAGEARKLEERLGQAAMGCAFLLQGGDYAESFEDFGANSIHDMFRLMLQMAVVLSFDGQMPPVKVRFFTPSPSILSSRSSFDLDPGVIPSTQTTCVILCLNTSSKQINICLNTQKHLTAFCLLV